MKRLPTYPVRFNRHYFATGIVILCLLIPTASSGSNLNLTGYIDEINLEAQEIMISGNPYHMDSETKVMAKDNTIGHDLLHQGMNVNYKIDLMTAIRSQPSIQQIQVISPISIEQLNQ